MTPPKNYNGILNGTNASLANPLAQLGFTLDANNNWIQNPTPNTEAPKETSTASLGDSIKAALGLMSKPVNMVDAYKQAEQEAGIETKRNLVSSLTDQLNSITAQSQADQLSVTGQGRGIPEAIIGGQQAQISKEAAIRALPVAAQLSAAQGDLEMAQEHLKTYFDIYKTDVQNQQAYQDKVASVVLQYMDKAEQRQYDEVQSVKKEASTIKLNAIENAQNIANTALESGQGSIFKAITALDPNSPTYNQDVARYGGQINSLDAQLKRAQIGSANRANQPTASDGKYTDKELKALTKLNQDVSKNSTYTKTTSMRNYGDNVIASLSLNSGVGDIAAINQFQKVIDEGAVTRDQDVKLIQGSQSLANTLKTKVKKLEKGEQLSPTLRQQMRTAVEAMYEKQVSALQKDPYISAKTKEAELYGLTVDDTVLGELGAFSKTESQIPAKTGDTKSWNGKVFKVINGVWTEQ